MQLGIVTLRDRQVSRVELREADGFAAAPARTRQPLRGPAERADHGLAVAASEQKHRRVAANQDGAAVARDAGAGRQWTAGQGCTTEAQLAQIGRASCRERV